MLKGVEEVNLLLEDMGLNLQSMAASPHVRPFADDVRAWEQRLSLIGEALEVCVCKGRAPGARRSGRHQHVACSNAQRWPEQARSHTSTTAHRCHRRCGCWCSASGCTWRASSSAGACVGD